MDRTIESGRAPNHSGAGRMRVGSPASSNAASANRHPGPEERKGPRRRFDQPRDLAGNSEASVGGRTRTPGAPTVPDRSGSNATSASGPLMSALQQGQGFLAHRFRLCWRLVDVRAFLDRAQEPETADLPAKAVLRFACPDHEHREAIVIALSLASISSLTSRDGGRVPGGLREMAACFHRRVGPSKLVAAGSRTCVASPPADGALARRVRWPGTGTAAGSIHGPLFSASRDAEHSTVLVTV